MTISATYNLSMSSRNATALPLSSGASITSTLGNTISTYSADTKEFAATLTITAGGIAEIDLVNGDFTDKTRTGATTTDSFGTAVTMDKIRTIGLYADADNSADITVTIDRGTGTDIVVQVQPGSAIGMEFANLLTSGGTSLDIDFAGTADDVINVLITGVDAA